MNREIPLLLTDSRASLTANQALAFSDQASYLNPYKTGMWIDEIQVSYNNASTANAGPANLWVKLEMGTYRLTNEFVPAWILGAAKGSGQNIAAQTMFPFKLKRPMWLERGQWIMPTVMHKACAGTVALSNVRVSMVGRATEDGPSRGPRWRPWASAFVAATKASGADYTQNSSPADLFNPFPRDLYVERLNGRVSSNGFDSGSPTLAGAGRTRPASDCFVRMYNSNGAVLVRDETPFDMLFTFVERSWNLKSKLQPNGFYKAMLRQQYSTMSAGFDIIPMIAMVGYQLDPEWRA